MTDYAAFLEAKSQLNDPAGFEPIFQPDFLYDFQRTLTEWAIRTGRAALLQDCGTGKTPEELVWAENIIRKTNKPILILTPLAVAEQFVREGVKFGFAVTHARDGKIKPGINVVNYQRLGYFHPADFAGLVCDECFPGDTPVDTIGIDGVLSTRYIQDLQPGDGILNASGVDHVRATAKRRIDGVVILQVRGRRITCSDNHPFLTVHGWRPAKDLRAGDYLVETSTAVRVVRGDFPRQGWSGGEVCEILREVLLGEMADEHAGAQSESPQSSSAKEDRCGNSKSMECGHGHHPGTQAAFCGDGPHAGGVCQDEANAACERPSATDSRRQWDANAEATSGASGGVGNRVDGRVADQTGCQDDGRVSDVLQGRFRQQPLKDSDRSRWPFAQEPQGCGREEGRDAGVVRVDSVEVLELGHPSLDRWRNERGDVYFYDIEATQHPSFSVDGVLVHNSGVLKHHDAKTRKAVTAFASKIPYILLGTATPAPNDFMELGNSAEVLRVMRYTQMLAMFFTHDGKATSQWRLKGHSKKRFWQWVASWARAIRKPSDLGFADKDFILPPLNMVQHTLPSPNTPGMFWAEEAKTLNEQRAERRRTLKERCEKVASLVPSDRPFIAWCHLNVEGDLLTKLIPDAVQVAGSEDDDVKEDKLAAFGRGDIRVMVTKPKIAGFGLNWQHCSDVSFFPAHSFEQFYQAVRRCWRFGQTRPVTLNIVTSEAESRVLENMQRKERQAEELYDGLIREMSEFQLPKSQVSQQSLDPVQVPVWL